MQEATFTAVLLAGGNSERMGTDKASLMHRDGLPFWRHQVHMLDQVDPEVIMVAAQQRPDWLLEEIIWVKDDQAGFGPMSGISSALKGSSTSHLICLGIDLIEMIPDCLNYFCKYCTNGVGLVPHSDAGWEPLVAILPQEAATDVDDFLKTKKYKLQMLMDHLLLQGKIRPYPIPEEEKILFKNLNTMEEYQQWKGRA